jgi:hypothetical protein
VRPHTTRRQTLPGFPVIAALVLGILLALMLLLLPPLGTSQLRAAVRVPAVRSQMLVSTDWLARHLNEPAVVVLHVGERSGYSGKILEKHHVHKKDAPSGTAVAIRNVVHDAAHAELPIESVREGDVVGMHQLTLDSAGDTITLVHEAKSRRGFAEGAVRAAEWLQGKTGFYDFKDIFRELG